MYVQPNLVRDRSGTIMKRVTSTEEAALIFDAYGSILIASIINVFGFGIFVLQVIVYFDNHPKSSRGIRLLVYSVLLLNVVQTISNCSSTVKVTAVHPLDQNFLSNLHHLPETLISLITTLIIISITQLFFIRRCIQITDITRNPAERGLASQRIRRWALILVLSGLMAITFSTSLASIILYYQQDAIGLAVAVVGKIFNKLLVIWLSSSTALDICLCVLIIWQLRKATRDTQDKPRLVSYLSRLVFQSGIAFTALQVASLVLSLKKTDSPWSTVIIYFAAKAYSITLVASLANPNKTKSKNRNVATSTTMAYALAGPPPMEHIQSRQVTTGVCDGSCIKTEADANVTDSGILAKYLPAPSSSQANSSFSYRAQKSKFTPPAPPSILTSNTVFADQLHDEERDASPGFLDRLSMYGQEKQLHVQPSGRGMKRSKSLDAIGNV